MFHSQILESHKSNPLQNAVTTVRNGAEWAVGVAPVSDASLTSHYSV